jgi:hypothetical protein
MAPPSKLAIATGVVTRLVKEEASYHKEIQQQEARIKKAETSEGDENAEYTLRQEVCVTIIGEIRCMTSNYNTASSPPRDQERSTWYEDQD